MELPLIGEVRVGVVTDATRSRVSVALDGFPATVRCVVTDASWRGQRTFEPGERISGAVTLVDTDRNVVTLSTAATENPELWSFLAALRPGDQLSGRVAAIERFGVFVALDDGPPHPVFPGVGFVTAPELSWRRFDDYAGVVSVGEPVTGEFLAFDTWNGEARLSLKALLPDPFARFAVDHAVGDVLAGTVTRTVPFGFFVRVTEDIEGLVPSNSLPGGRVPGTGEQVTVGITGIDTARRRVSCALADAPG